MPIPAALAAAPQWVLWDWIERDGRPSKVPVQVDGSYASSTNPETWNTLEACQGVEADHAGLGFVFAASDPFVGVDLDACWNPATQQLAPWAREMLALAGLSYAEFSPSGTGIKIFGTLPIGWEIQGHRMTMTGPMIDQKLPGWERYTEGRFFTVTEHEGGTPRDQLEDLSRLMLHLDALLLTQRGKTEPPQAYDSNGTETRPTRLEALLRLDPDLMARWSGVTRGLRDESPSALDQAIANHLAFHRMTGAEIEQSLRWRRRELDLPMKHDGYFHLTVGKALRWAEDERERKEPLGPVQPPFEGPENRSGEDISEEEEKPSRKTWADLVEMDLRVDWIAQGLLPRVGISLIAAKPKAGKSTLARDLAWACATGDYFLGREIPEPLEVLYTDADGSLQTMGGHVKGFPDIEGARERVYLVHPQLDASDDLREELTAALQERRYGLVILDTLQTVMRAKDLNDYSEVGALFAYLREISAQHQTHICLVHHDRKAHAEGGDGTLGSTAIFGGVDTLIQLARDPEGIRSVASIQRDGEDMDPHEVTLEAGRIVLGSSTSQAKAMRREEKREASKAGAQSRIMNMVAQSPGISKTKLLDSITGDQKVIRALVEELISEGQLREERDGRTKRIYLAKPH